MIARAIVLTLNAFANRTSSEKKVLASDCRAFSPKNSTHSLKESIAVRASLFNRFSFSSELFKKSRNTVLCLSLLLSSYSFRTRSMPFSNSWTSVVMFSIETTNKQNLNFFCSLYPHFQFCSTTFFFQFCLPVAALSMCMSSDSKFISSGNLTRIVATM